MRERGGSAVAFGAALMVVVASGCASGAKQEVKPKPVVEAKREEPKAVVEAPKPQPPAFCGEVEGVREFSRTGYRWCARPDGTKHGRFAVVSDGVTLMEGALKEGQLDGPWAAYQADGSKRWTATFKDGQEEGVVEIFYRGGAQRHSAVPHVAGKPHGEAVYWHPNGKQAAVLRFEQGKPTGKWEFWHEDGSKAHVQPWKSGETQGVHLHWDRKGKKVNAPVGRLSNSQIQPRFEGLERHVIDCYRHARVIDAGQGKLAMQLVVQYSGDVSQISMFDSDFKHNFLQKCARREVEALRFPDNPYGPQRLIKSWTLSVSG